MIVWSDRTGKGGCVKEVIIRVESEDSYEDLSIRAESATQQ